MYREWLLLFLEPKDQYCKSVFMAMQVKKNQLQLLPIHRARTIG